MTWGLSCAKDRERKPSVATLGRSIQAPRIEEDAHSVRNTNFEVNEKPKAHLLGDGILIEGKDRHSACAFARLGVKGPGFGLG